MSNKLQSSNWVNSLTSVPETFWCITGKMWENYSLHLKLFGCFVELGLFQILSCCLVIYCLRLDSTKYKTTVLITNTNYWNRKTWSISVKLQLTVIWYKDWRTQSKLQTYLKFTCPPQKIICLVMSFKLVFLNTTY